MGRKAKKRGYACIADSLFCTPETNTALLRNYTPIKINLKKIPRDIGKKKNKFRGKFWWFSGYGCELSLLRVWVQSVTRELKIPQATWWGQNNKFRDSFFFFKETICTLNICKMCVLIFTLTLLTCICTVHIFATKDDQVSNGSVKMSLFVDRHFTKRRKSW